MCVYICPFREYLAVFKKTVQVHEVFLQRLSSHPIFSKDRNFQIFLEYDQDVSFPLCLKFFFSRPGNIVAARESVGFAYFLKMCSVGRLRENGESKG